MEFDNSLPAIEVPVPKWFLSWKEIYEMSPSRRHMSYEQELHNRQSAGQFMHLLTERLNQGFTEKWRKVSMLCACAALMHVNRVFTLHSFQDLDYRDVCAGAMLMTAKAEDCQRSLRQVVKAWWSLRFPTKPQIPDEYYDDAAHRIEFFESVVLQSLAFDINVELPQPIAVQKIQNLGMSSALTEAAYLYVADMLTYTDWMIRYDQRKLAAMAVFHVCLWSGKELSAELVAKELHPTLQVKWLKDRAIEFCTHHKRAPKPAILKIQKLIDNGLLKYISRSAERKSLPLSSPAASSTPVPSASLSPKAEENPKEQVVAQKRAAPEAEIREEPSIKRTCSARVTEDTPEVSTEAMLGAMIEASVLPEMMSPPQMIKEMEPVASTYKREPTPVEAHKVREAQPTEKPEKPEGKKPQPQKAGHVAKEARRGSGAWCADSSRLGSPEDRQMALKKMYEMERQKDAQWAKEKRMEGLRRMAEQRMIKERKEEKNKLKFRAKEAEPKKRKASEHVAVSKQIVPEVAPAPARQEAPKPKKLNFEEYKRRLSEKAKPHQTPEAEQTKEPRTNFMKPAAQEEDEISLKDIKFSVAPKAPKLPRVEAPNLNAKKIEEATRRFREQAVHIQAVRTTKIATIEHQPAPAAWRIPKKSRQSIDSAIEVSPASSTENFAHSSTSDSVQGSPPEQRRSLPSLLSMEIAAPENYKAGHYLEPLAGYCDFDEMEEGEIL
ncbi:unnamed protein product, partial [Mesorhabditis spiculigera]